MYISTSRKKGKQKTKKKTQFTSVSVMSVSVCVSDQWAGEKSQHLVKSDGGLARED